MNAYSLDLRARLVRACEQECLTCREAAEDFGVRPAFVQQLLQQLQDEGSLAPKKGGAARLRSWMRSRRSGCGDASRTTPMPPCRNCALS